MAKNMPTQEDYIKIAELLDKYHNTDDIKVKTHSKTLIVTIMIPVVKKIARTIARRRYDPVEDLIQAGFIGLLKAIEGFSKEINDNFRVYAGYLIIGEMKHYLRDKRNVIRVPAYIQELTVRINNFTANLSPQEMIGLTTDEVASALDVSTRAVDLAMMVERRRSTLSLDEIYQDDESLSYEELLAEKGFKERLEYEDAKILFDDVINKLPPEEKILIDMYYKQDMTQREIAEALVINEMTLSRRMKQTFNIIANLVAEKTLKQASLEVEKKNEDNE